MTDIFTALKNRIPTGTIPGKARVINKVLGVAEHLATAVKEVSSRDDLSPKGRAPLLQKHVKDFGAALRRAERQLAYHTDKIARGRVNLAEKVVGKAKETDAEWRTMLRGLPLAERTSLAMSDPDARGAVLRAPAALSGMPKDRVEMLLANAIEQEAPAELAAINVHEESHEVHRVAVNVLRGELMKVPFLLEPNGNLAKPHSAIQLDTFIDADAKQPFPKDLALEEAEVDDTNE